MLGDYLTGLEQREECAITLQNDKGPVKTVFIIKNLPGWADMEVGRAENMLTAKGYEATQAASYAWASFGLVRIENMNEEGDSIVPPDTDKGKAVSGDTWKRIPISWLVKKLPYRSVVAELSTAIFAHNCLTPAQRKNWTWPPVSTEPDKKEDSIASGPEAKQETGTEKAPPVEVASTDMTPVDGAITVATVAEEQ